MSWLTRAAGWLGVASWARIGAVMLAIGAAAASGGFAAGARWERGAAAVTANVTLRDEVSQLRGVADALRQHGLDVAQDFRTAQRRLEQVVHDNEQRLAANRAALAAQTRALEQLLADHPELRDVSIGADGVRHWNRASEPAAAAPAPDNRPEPAAALPAGAVAPAAGRRRGSARRARPRRRAVPQLPRPAGGAGRRRD